MMAGTSRINKTMVTADPASIAKMNSEVLCISILPLMNVFAILYHNVFRKSIVFDQGLANGFGIRGIHEHSVMGDQATIPCGTKNGPCSQHCCLLMMEPL